MRDRLHCALPATVLASHSTLPPAQAALLTVIVYASDFAPNYYLTGKLFREKMKKNPPRFPTSSPIHPEINYIIGIQVIVGRLVSHKLLLLASFALAWWLYDGHAWHDAIDDEAPSSILCGSANYFD
jgi:hypothetical protein